MHGAGRNGPARVSVNLDPRDFPQAFSATGFSMTFEIGRALEMSILERETPDITASVQAVTTYLGRIEVVYE
jgi:hypothetical protein